MGSRLVWFVAGCLIGVVIGYIVRSLREIKEKVDTVDEHITEQKKGDAGFLTIELMKNIALFLVVALTVYSAFASQLASNKTTDNQKEIQKTTSCNQQFLSKTIAALNARTAYSQDQTQANVDLQKAQGLFLTGLAEETGTATTLDRSALAQYIQALTNFTTLANKSSTQVSENPYPTSVDYTNCLHGK